MSRPGRTVFDDSNGNGFLNAGETSFVSDSNGLFSTRLVAGSHTLRQLQPSGYVATGQSLLTTNAGSTFAKDGVLRLPLDVNPNGAAIVSLGSVVPATAPGSINVSVFADANGNGVLDTNESFESSADTVYLDLNRNGKFDPGEPSRLLSDSVASFTVAAGTYLVRLIPKDTHAVAEPAGGVSVKVTSGNVASARLGVAPAPTASVSVSGFAFNDTDGNGVLGVNETKASGKTVFLDTNANDKLDAGEKSVITTAAGAWAFTGLTAGTYHVRRVFPSGYSQSTPLIDVTLAAGQAVSGLTIGSVSGTVGPVQTASISGFAFNDANKDGLYDGTDSLAAGKTVFIDLDDDGFKDANEMSVITDSKGAFGFKNLTAGTYHVRRLFPKGYAESTPAHYVSLTAGQAAAGIGIGSRAV